jgi:CCR4-NOT transcription complex subunit 7/8
VIDEVNSGPRDMREYLRIKANADILKIIQLGVTISDAQGRLPSPVSTWQFNFDFNIDTEKKNQVSIQLLQDHGIDFGQLKLHGISPHYFAEKFI